MLKLSQQISTSIDQKLVGISEISSNHQFIFRINNGLRMTCKAAYEPEMVSIGPYHRGKKKLQKMENYKLKYLQGILKRQNKSSARRYINSLILDEEKARSYYEEEVSMSQQKFVEMMLLDGCFIVEFLRKCQNKDEDSIFQMSCIFEILRTDLLLFENQIPYFILVKLFDMTKSPDDDQGMDLFSLAKSCFEGRITFSNTINHEPSSSSITRQPERVFHLLSLMYGIWCPSIVHGQDNDQNGSNSDQKHCDEFSCITLGKPCGGVNEQPQERDLLDMMFIKSVCELEQDGIKFGESKQSTSWLDIKFENGEIKIPHLVIEDTTESILRNLIAYEQYMSDLGHCKKSVTDYAQFMDCLINTPMDVQQLRVKGIIKNWLGDDEKITYMFNKICKNVMFSSSDFAYQKIFRKVNEHCKNRCNPWRSSFMKTHFKNPWSIMSLLGAIILLVLTLIQTIFSVLQQFKKDPKVVCNCK